MLLQRKSAAFAGSFDFVAAAAFWHEYVRWLLHFCCNDLKLLVASACLAFAFRGIAFLSQRGYTPLQAA